MDLNSQIKVSALVAILKKELECQHRFVRVVGEIRSFKEWRSGHGYFDLKDEEASLPVVIFKPHLAKVPFKISDGMEVLLSGRVSVYSANARLQFIAETIEPLGQGALALAFIQLKEKLLKEGLFDAGSKKAIKSFNKTIGLVTSSQGAVLFDMLRIILSRMPKTNILLSPVRVQGAMAKEEIAEAIARLDRSGECDVIIVGRGGGSLEDLWAFNEELVARAIFACRTPIVSAVGHETDTSISDLVADLRAATPTHAAHLVSLDLAEVLDEIKSMKQSLTTAMLRKFEQGQFKISQEEKRLSELKVLLFRYWQELDELNKRLNDNWLRIIKIHELTLKEQTKRLASLQPLRQLRLKQEQLSQAKSRLNAIAIIAPARHALLNFVTKLEALSPLKVLGRGFSLLEDSQTRLIITQVAQLNLGQLINIRLQDGSIKAEIIAKDSYGTK